MSDRWPLVPLGRLLSKSEEWVSLEPDAVYREVTVRLWGKGVVERRKATGAEIAADKRMVARAGQFILSRIDARNGALGLVPDELDGAVVSHDFPVFDLRTILLFPPYLAWLSRTRTFVDLCRTASEGTTNRVRLQETRFLAAEMPLPPLDEQSRIVARIEELAARIEEARGLRRETIEESSAFLSSEAGRIVANIAARFEVRSLGSYNPHVTSGPRYWNSRYSNTGFRFYRAQDIGSEGKILNDSRVYVVPPDSQQGQTALLAVGDLMFVITGATVGRCTVFPDDLEPGYVSQHVAICRLPSNEVLPAFALWCLRAPQGQSQLLGQRYGQGKPGLNLSNIRALKLPIPPLLEQRRIVAYLDDLQARVDALKRLQAETAAELDALLPSVLDKVFRGEL
jgi:type I restriction enzyme, S subunit